MMATMEIREIENGFVLTVYDSKRYENSREYFCEDLTDVFVLARETFEHRGEDEVSSKD